MKYEEQLVPVDHFLRTEQMEPGDPIERSRVRRQALKLVGFQDRLFREEGKKVVAVVPRTHRDGVMKFMQNYMGNW